MDYIKEKLFSIYSKENAEEIMNKYASNMNKDIEIIKSQTDLDYKASLEVYFNNDFDSVKSICIFFDIPYEKKKNEKELTDIQKKLLELRKIADDKDNYYDNKISS